MIEIFTTETCPKCTILKKKLDDAGIEYTIGDNKEILDAGYTGVPILKVNEEFLNFRKAVEWVNEKKRSN